MILEVQFEKQIHEFEGILDAKILHSGLILWDRIFFFLTLITKYVHFDVFDWPL